MIVKQKIYKRSTIHYLGGPLPEGYLYVGTHHQGGPIWGSIDTVASSKMDDVDPRFPAA